MDSTMQGPRPRDAAKPSPAGGGKGNGAAEVELKLLTEEGGARAFATAPAVDACARNKGVVRRLEAAYFDTPDRALEKAGFALRVRRNGGRFVMTVKTLRPLVAGGLARGEWEAPVDELRPDLTRLADDAPAEFMAVARDGELVEQYRTVVRRHTRLLDLPHAVIELAADEGRVIAGPLAEPISEVELELKEGDTAALYEFALTLCEAGRLDPSPRSKAARGQDLAHGRPPAYVKATRPELDAAVTLDEAIARILRSAYDHLLANKAAAEDGGHPEGVHQARIALRRLRSMLGILSATAGSPAIAAFREEAKWLASRMNDARNWDVFLTETLPPIEAGCGEAVDFSALRSAAQRWRAQGYDGVRAALCGARAARFQLELALWIEQRGWRGGADAEGLAQLAGPARLFAEAVLARLHRKVVRRGRKFARLGIEERHEVRLAMKRLRYAADFFLPLFNGSRKAAAYARLLGRFQDLLGRYNDMATTAGLLAVLGRDERAPALARSGGAVIGWQASELAATETALVEAWRDFKTAGRMWKGGR